MFRHVVMFHWSEESTQAQREAALEALEALPECIEEVRTFSVGIDVGRTDTNHDLVVVADFDDEEAYRRYADHPDHRSLVSDQLGPVAHGRAAVQHVLPRGT